MTTNKLNIVALIVTGSPTDRCYFAVVRLSRAVDAYCFSFMLQAYNSLIVLFVVSVVEGDLFPCANCLSACFLRSLYIVQYKYLL